MRGKIDGRAWGVEGCGFEEMISNRAIIVRVEAFTPITSTSQTMRESLILICISRDNR